MSMRRPGHARHPHGLTDAQLCTAWQLVSLLVDYPEESLPGCVPAFVRVARALPEPVAGPLLRFLDHVAATDLGELQAAYVTTFDHDKRGCLYLTYPSYGDTRRRGVALVRFKQEFRRAGVELTAEELPDHLSVVLEFGATADLAIAARLLADHRVAVELLRTGLAEDGSPWADVLQALTETLPPLAGDERTRIARLIAEGPPVEEVGLAGYGVAEARPTGQRRGPATTGGEGAR